MEVAAEAAVDDQWLSGQVVDQLSWHILSGDQLDVAHAHVAVDGGAEASRQAVGKGVHVHGKGQTQL